MISDRVKHGAILFTWIVVPITRNIQVTHTSTDAHEGSLLSEKFNMMRDVFIGKVNASQIAFNQEGRVESGYLHEPLVNENVIIHCIFNHFPAKSFTQLNSLIFSVKEFVCICITQRTHESFS